MSQLERANDFEASLRAQIRAALLQLQTAMPVQIVAVTADGGTFPAYDPSNEYVLLPTPHQGSPADAGRNIRLV